MTDTLRVIAQRYGCWHYTLRLLSTFAGTKSETHSSDDFKKKSLKKTTPQCGEKYVCYEGPMI